MTALKDPFEYKDKEKESVGLDTGLQMIIFDSPNDDMGHQVINCESVKHMWDTTELIMVGTYEV